MVYIFCEKLFMIFILSKSTWSLAKRSFIAFKIHFLTRALVSRGLFLALIMLVWTFFICETIYKFLNYQN